MGLFLEIGPCRVTPNGNGTTRFDHSWTEFSNLLILDQPAGVGMSALDDASACRPETLKKAADDFETFLNVFFTDAFPQYGHLPIHIAGESFAGAYIPTYVANIIHRQKVRASGALNVHLASIILVDAVINQPISGVVGEYNHFCNPETKDNITTGGLNETACNAMEEKIPECERLNSLCLDTYDPVICQSSNYWCMEEVGIWISRDVENGKRNPYDDRKACKHNPPICEDIITSRHAQYLNQPWVKEHLGKPPNFTFKGLDFDLNMLWAQNKQSTLPTTREMSFLLDKTDVRILALNGNNDILVNTEGQIRVYDSLPWSGMARYRLAKFSDWFYTKRKGAFLTAVKAGQVKGVKNKLRLVTVQEAGHASPADQPEAIAFVVQCWVNGAPCHDSLLV
ncbi:Alpha/Beta hydrolase protein [Aspergillus venezuelensis]